MSEPLYNAEQLSAITRKSDWRGVWLVTCQYAITLAIFVVAAIWPNPITIILGTILLGGRQLGFFVLTHETGHRTLFASNQINKFVGRWLTGPMDFSNPDAYMREHLLHHRAAGQQDDPDLTNYADYPISKSRLKRKLKRDLTGQTGWRNLSHRLKMFAHLGDLDEEDRHALVRGAGFNLAMLLLMWMGGAAWLYLMWIAALVFVYPAIIRIRQIAEHAAVPDLSSDDPRMNTRTTYANPLVRLLLCPHQVNFHVEHHLLASIPIYRLRAAHEILRNKGYYADTSISNGYLQVLREVTA